MDNVVEGYKIPIIQYEIYNSKTKEKLDLDICKDMKIIVSIPVNIDENELYKYDPTSNYYNHYSFDYLL